MNFVYLIAPIFMITLDLIWIGLNKTMYKRMVENVQHSKLKFRITSAVIAYCAMIISLTLFVIPAALKDPSKNNVYKALKYGASHGFIIYTIYNATNFAVFENYPLDVAVIDTIWGTTVYFLSTLFALYLY